MENRPGNHHDPYAVAQDLRTGREWEFSVPLVTNRFFLYDTIKVLFWTFFIFTGGMLIIFSFQKGIDSVIPFLKMMALIFLGFLVAIPGVALFFFCNRYPMRFEITARGAFYSSLSRLAAVSNRAAVVAGLLSLKAGIAGAGLISMSQESGGILWEDVHRIREHPARHVITLMNRWRAVLRLYCTAEDYPHLLEFVRSHTAAAAMRRQSAAEAAVPEPSRWRRQALWSLAALTACAAVWACPLEFNAGILWLILGCSLLSIWIPGLRRIAAGLALTGTGWLLFAIIHLGAETQELISRQVLNGADMPAWARYTLFGSMNAVEWFRFGVCCAGLLGLSALAIAAGRRRSP